MEAPAESRLTGRIVAVNALDRKARQAMYQLLAAHFDGTDPATFAADLAEKNCAILLEDDLGILRGFSTLLLYRSCAGGAPTSIVYSGDTIVERAWWGSSALPRMWIRAVRDLAALDSTHRLYWFLLTSGYRTYRFLPVFFRSFYPKHDDAATPMADLLRIVASEKFGDRYNPATGIVRLARPQVLTADLLELPARRGLDPHVAFFVSRNPGYVHGDELACLTRVHDENLTRAGRRMTRRQKETR